MVPSVPLQVVGLVKAVEEIAGVVFTTTEVQADGEVQLATVIVAQYEPAIATVAPLLVGFCRAETNPDGPVQA